MRISTAHNYDTSVETLQKRQSDMSESQMQLTSGKRVNRASDDPIAAARAERALATISNTEANQRALDASRNVMTLTESALGDTVDLVQQAREALVAAGNGSYDSQQRDSLAKRLEEIRKQLMSVANRPDGGGGYIFGGQGSESPPFADAPDSTNPLGHSVQFQGNGGETMSPATEALSLTVDGGATWLAAPSGNGMFVTSAAMDASTGDYTNTGSAWITPGTVADPTTFMATTMPTNGYAISFDTTTTPTTYSVVDQDSSTTVASGNYTSGQAITFNGMSVTVSGTPDNGDSFLVKDSQYNLSVFDALDKAIYGLQNETASGNIQQVVNTGMSDLDSVLSNIQASRSKVGEALNRMDGIESRNSSLKLAAQTERSNAEDLDMVDGISNFQNQQSGYQAALQSYAMIQKLSLFQYING